MKWLDLLSRSRRPSAAVLPPQISARAPAGIDYLLGHADRNEFASDQPIYLRLDKPGSEANSPDPVVPDPLLEQTAVTQRSPNQTPPDPRSPGQSAIDPCLLDQTAVPPSSPSQTALDPHLPEQTALDPRSPDKSGVPPGPPSQASHAANSSDPSPLGQKKAWEVLNEAAEELQQRQDWAGAEPLWRAMRKGFAHIWYGYTAGATALSALGRNDEALQVLTQGAHRFPLEYTIRHDLGQLAMRQCDWRAAERHWRIAIGFPVRPWAYTELARSLEQQGRLTEAEAVLLEGQIEEPDELSLYTHYARMVWKREDWAAAVDNLAKAHQRFPTSDEISSDMMQALVRLAEHDPIAADVAHRAFNLIAEAAATRSDKYKLMMRFESLGGLGPDGGCEFGGVQRTHAAEPLGLFRWASVSPESLIACLEERFRGIGEADATTIYVHEDDPDALWQIGDKTYGTAMHSFVPSHDVPYDKMASAAQKRQCYLRAKLIADLENPEKIFVLKIGYRQLNAAAIEALSRAIASYGKGELLCVCPADPKHPHGQIEAVAPNVYIGYIDFSGRLDIVQRHAGWEAMCQTMWDMSALSHAGQISA